MYLNEQLKPSICTVLHIFCRDTLDIMADRFLYYIKRYCILQYVDKKQAVVLGKERTA